MGAAKVLHGRHENNWTDEFRERRAALSIYARRAAIVFTIFLIFVLFPISAFKHAIEMDQVPPQGPARLDPVDAENLMRLLNLSGTPAPRCEPDHDQGGFYET
ncbi:MAG TPA: hypothetical protein VFV50_19260 [Bdellovibrionales bacterium]|nr:hypothetical protein [Bdellovibrionales bacterium]